MYEEIYEFENLYKAYQKARLGKMWKDGTCKYAINALEATVLLQKLLETKQYKMGQYNTFKVQEPKERIIQALPFKDKVVQHSLCDNILEPILEKHFIYDNYASRKGKGVHAGLERLSAFLRRFYRLHGCEGYFLKCDISKYFYSIDHSVLRMKLAKLIKDDEVMWLIDMIINSTPNPGIPIGNQTSQLFALLYLSDMDHFIKEKLRIKYYIRYMDDFLLIHEDKEYLKYCWEEIIKHLEVHKLKLNNKTQIFPIKNGVDFLGFHTYMTESGKVIRKIRRDSKSNVKHKMKKFKRMYQEGRISKERIDVSFSSWMGHAGHGNTYHLRRKMRQKYEEIFEEE